jgi:hypothetical protein
MKIRPVGAELFHGDEQTDGRTDRQTAAAILRTSPKTENLRNDLSVLTVSLTKLYV